MSHSIIPTECVWCEIGEILDGVCNKCGHIYGARPMRKKKRVGFILPKVKEALPEHIEKNLRPNYKPNGKVA